MKRKDLLLLGVLTSTPFWIALAEQWYLRLFAVFFGFVLMMALFEMNDEKNRLKEKIEKMKRVYKNLQKY